MSSTPAPGPPLPVRTPAPHNHICALFHNRDEEYSALLPFIRKGFERGDKAVHIVDPKLRDEHLRRLQNSSINTHAAELRHQLEVKVWQETYLRKGHFDSGDMVRVLKEIITTAHSQGYGRARIIGHMEWILEDWPVDVLQYEKSLNSLLGAYRDPVICVYNCARFDARIVMDVLRLHPVVMISGVLHRNPFFVRPEELLKEAQDGQTVLTDRMEPGISTETRYTHRAISELVAISTISAEWVGQQPTKIAADIVSILMQCPRIEAAYLLLRQANQPNVAHIRAEGWPQFERWLETIDTPPGSEIISEERRIELPHDGKTLYVLQIPIGIEAQAGWIAVGSAQPDFPGEMDRLVLTIAANQGQISFQNARLLRERERVTSELEVLREDVDRSTGLDELGGSSAAIGETLSKISKVAPTDSTVLITGETGTGKELAARAIHQHSRRAHEPFISVNFAALPASLVASELFGHERGAFTGADRRRLGRFELADGGTLFLDEIGEISLEVQTTLLRVLQERVIERLGGAEPIRIDVRLIAATNRDLQQAVADGSFRSDLYYRLHIFPLEMPPLRDRREDIPLLTQHFVDRYAATLGKKIRRIDPATMDRFLSYRWPGNIRELQNVVERSLILGEGDTFSVHSLWPGIDRMDQPQGSLLEKMSVYERELIESALRETGGRVSGAYGAARRLGIPSTTLESRIKALNIKKSVFQA